jgi:hypothetical protein
MTTVTVHMQMNGTVTAVAVAVAVAVVAVAAAGRLYCRKSFTAAQASIFSEPSMKVLNLSKLCLTRHYAVDTSGSSR